MKLKELLDNVFADGPIPYDEFHVSDYLLMHENLSLFMNSIKQCDEFSDVTELKQISHPNVIDKNENVFTAKSMILNPDIKLSGIIHLYSISLSPTIYNPNDFYKPVKNNASISPPVYDPIDFSVHKSIVLQFSPEQKQDFEAIDMIVGLNKGTSYNIHNYDTRKQLHETLDMILDNPSEYETKGTRNIIIRGIFQNYESTEPQYPLIDDPEIVGYSVYYMSNETYDSGEVVLNLKSKIIPAKLKELFLEKFKDTKVPTEDEINKFIKENL